MWSMRRLNAIQYERFDGGLTDKTGAATAEWAADRAGP